MPTVDLILAVCMFANPSSCAKSTSISNRTARSEPACPKRSRPWPNGPAITRSGTSRGSIASGRTPRKRRPDGSAMVVLRAVRSERRDTPPQSLEPASRPALVVSDVSFTYKTARVLDDVSFTVEKGRFTALLGPNGAGKTTLFSLITRLLATRQGAIVDQRSRHPRSRRPDRSPRSASSSSSRPSTSTSPSGRTCTISPCCAASRGRRRTGASSAS